MRDESLNGLELAASLSGDDQLSAVKLVVMVEGTTPHERRLLEQLGVFRVLQKPVDLEALRETFRLAVDDVDRLDAARQA